MADTDKMPETVAEVTPKNDTPAPVTPPVEEKKTEDSEVEKERKLREQAEMRANQLANQLKAKDDAEAAAKAKELEENNEFKTLYEQEKARREELEASQEADQKAKEVKDTSESILSDYSDDVKALAEDAGLELKDVSEDAVAEFKGRLDKFQTRIGSGKVGPNNPGSPSNKKEYTREELHEILNDPAKRDAYYKAKGGVASDVMAS